MLAGWSAGALRPIAGYLQPLQMTLWRDTHPSARDLESALNAARSHASQSAAARLQLLPGLPQARQAAAAATSAAAGLAIGMSSLAAYEGQAAAQRGQEGGGSEAVVIEAQALSRFCWDTAVQPFAVEAAALAATAALRPGTDMTAADVAATHAAAEEAAIAALQHATLLTTLPLWLIPGRCPCDNLQQCYTRGALVAVEG